MRAALRRLLDRIETPHYAGRHPADQPHTPRITWWPNEWANAAWADIAARHELDKGEDDS